MTTMITCVKCGHQQPLGRRDCERCGVILAKAKRTSPRPRPQGAPPKGLRKLLDKAPNGNQRPGVPEQTQRDQQPLPKGPGRPVRSRDRAVVMSELAGLVRSGCTMAEAMDSIATAMRPAVQKSLQHAGQRLRDGESLAVSLQSPLSLDSVERALLHTAQTTGRVDAMLDQLAARANTILEVKQRIRAAIAWPMLTLMSAVFMIPFPDLLTKGVTTYLTMVGMWLGSIGTVIGGGWAIYKLVARSPSVSLLIFRAAGYVPVLRSFIIARRYSLLFGALGPALDAGLPLPEALRLSQQATQDPTVNGALEDFQTRIDHGQDVMPAIQALPALPSAAAAQLAGGLKTGRLADACIAIAEEQFRGYQKASDRLGLVVRYSLTMVISMVVGYAIIQQMSTMLGNPLALSPGGKSGEMSRELLRHMPSLK
ncbi:MAG TPA: hypothetical protein DCQ06_07840 [Myxococcales bacterium]|nr:hypothetical protein [Myxococcales bacterium]